MESIIVTKTPDLTCSYSGKTLITYSIVNYLTQTPSWISIDPASGHLIIAAPNVTVDTTYSFYISSIVTGSSPIQKLISITVLNWAVEFCSTCSITSASVCSVWNTGYSLTNSNTCLINTAAASALASNSVKVQTIINLVIIGVVAWVIALLKLLNVSSLSNLWSLLGQIQLQWITIRLLIIKL